MLSTDCSSCAMTQSYFCWTAHIRWGAKNLLIKEVVLRLTSVVYPPREKITKIIRPEYFCGTFLGAVTAKLRNYQEVNSPRIMLRNCWPQRPQTRPCWVTRNLRNSQENISQGILLRSWLRKAVAITLKIIPQDFFFVSAIFWGGGG